MASMIGRSENASLPEEEGGLRADPHAGLMMRSPVEEAGEEAAGDGVPPLSKQKSKSIIRMAIVAGGAVTVAVAGFVGYSMIFANGGDVQPLRPQMPSPAASVVSPSTESGNPALSVAGGGSLSLPPLPPGSVAWGGGGASPSVGSSPLPTAAVPPAPSPVSPSSSGGLSLPSGDSFPQFATGGVSGSAPVGSSGESLAAMPSVVGGGGLSPSGTGPVAGAPGAVESSAVLADITRRLDSINGSLMRFEPLMGMVADVAGRLTSTESRLDRLEEELRRQAREKAGAAEVHSSSSDAVLEFLLSRIAEMDVSSGRSAATSVAARGRPGVQPVPVTVTAASDHVRFVVRIPASVDSLVYDIVREPLPNGMVRYEVTFPDRVQVDLGQLPADLRGVTAIMSSVGSFEFRVPPDREVRHGMFANNTLFVGVYDAGIEPPPQAGALVRQRSEEDRLQAERRRAEASRLREAIGRWSVLLADGTRGVLRDGDGRLHVVSAGSELVFGDGLRATILQFRRDGQRWVADTSFGLTVPAARPSSSDPLRTGG